MEIKLTADYDSDNTDTKNSTIFLSAYGPETGRVVCLVIDGRELRFGRDHAKIWSSYAAALYERVHAALGADKHKHRYLLYQDTLTPAARASMQGAEGVLFQSAEPKKSLQVIQ